MKDTSILIIILLITVSVCGDRRPRQCKRKSIKDKFYQEIKLVGVCENRPLGDVSETHLAELWSSCYGKALSFATKRSVYFSDLYNSYLVDENVDNTFSTSWISKTLSYFEIFKSSPKPVPILKSWKDKIKTFLNNRTIEEQIIDILAEHYEWLTVILVIVIVNIKYFSWNTNCDKQDYINYQIDYVRHHVSCFSQYKLLKIIGEGGFSIVYVAKKIDSGMEDLFAIKVMNKRKYIEGYSKETAMRNCTYTGIEVFVGRLGRINHFIVPVVMSVQIRTHLAIVMPAYKAGSLSDQLRMRDHMPFSEVQIKFFSVELICGIKFLHSKGIMHNDIKPGNVLIDMKGHVRLGDFGAAVLGLREGETYSTPVYGTFGYMALELVMAQKYSMSTDFWSLGATLYYLSNPPNVPFGYPDISSDSISGGNEYAKQEVRNYLDKVRAQEYEKSEEYSGIFYQFVSDLLMVNGYDRLGSTNSSLGPIEQHSFFSGIDWEAIENHRKLPQYTPVERDIYNSDTLNPEDELPVTERDLEIWERSKFQFMEEYFEDVSSTSSAD